MFGRGWKCDICGRGNAKDRTVCLYCSTPLEGGPPLRYGQWICSQGTRNERDVLSCPCCGVVAPRRTLEPTKGYGLGKLMSAVEDDGQGEAVGGDGFCRQCGAEMRAGDHFCGACGARAGA